MKKLFSVLLAIVMVLGMVSVATAADGSITITNPNADKEYRAYKVFDVTVDGESLIYSTTDAKIIADATASGFFDLMEENDVTYVTRKDEVSDAAILAWVKSIKDDLGDPESDVDGKFEDLSLGYYYITTSNGTLVSITNVGEEIEIVDKSSSPSWDPEDPENPDDTPDDEDGKTGTGKFVANADENGEPTDYAKFNSASIGDKVFFKINVYAPQYNGGNVVTEYTITDTLPDGITNITQVSANVTATTSVNGNTITYNFVVDQAGYPEDGHVSIVYSATVDTDAVYKNINQVDLTWKQYNPSFDPENPGDVDGDGDVDKDDYDPKNPDPDQGTPENPATPDDEDVPETSKTTTYTYGFNLKKTDGTTGIDGAKFTLNAGTKDNVGAVIALAKNSDGTYRPAVEGETAVVLTAGNVIIKGLDAGSYVLTEIEAPKGYNLPEGAAARTNVTIDADAVNENGISNTIVEVVNQAGAILPSTGGMGTYLFYIVGGVLMVGAIVLLITKKRMSNK